VSTQYDLIVIGAGPAGLAAAAETAGAGLKTLLLDKLGPGGAMINFGLIESDPDGHTGPALVGNMTDDVTAAGGEIGFGEVTRVSGGSPWVVETEDGERRESRAVLIATGFNKGRLGIADEDSWEGRGLSHCAVCDGPLYSGQPVIVAGTGGWVGHEVKELAGLAGEVIVVGDEAVESETGNVTLKPGRIVALEGADGVEKVVIEKDGARSTIEANAVFVYTGESPAAEFVADLLARDAAGHIVVDKDGNASKPLIFATGNVSSEDAGTLRHVGHARGDGERVARTIIAKLKS
jgi:thioredoxin reductase (NADPH)